MPGHAQARRLDQARAFPALPRFSPTQKILFSPLCTGELHVVVCLRGDEDAPVVLHA